MYINYSSSLYMFRGKKNLVLVLDLFILAWYSIQCSMSIWCPSKRYICFICVFKYKVVWEDLTTKDYSAELSLQQVAQI